MARLSYVEAETATSEVRQTYEEALQGRPLRFHQLLAHRPEVLKTITPFYASVGRSLPRRLYELVYLRVSMINASPYCTQHHLLASRQADIVPDDWPLLNTGDYSACSPQERTALLFTEKLTRNPGQVEDHDIELLKRHFSDEQIVDLHLLVGLANLTNRITGPLAADFEFAEETISAQAAAAD